MDDVVQIHDLTRMELQGGPKQADVAKYNSRLIRVTGPGGSPLYAHRHMASAIAWEFEEVPLTLYLHNSTGDFLDDSLSTCSLEDLEKCELHVGDRTVYCLERCVRSGCYSGVRESSTRFYYAFGAEDDEGQYEVSVGVEFGPTENDEDTVVRFDELVSRGVEYVRFLHVYFMRDPFSDGD